MHGYLAGRSGSQPLAATLCMAASSRLACRNAARGRARAASPALHLLCVQRDLASIGGEIDQILAPIITVGFPHRGMLCSEDLTLLKVTHARARAHTHTHTIVSECRSLSITTAGHRMKYYFLLLQLAFLESRGGQVPPVLAIGECGPQHASWHANLQYLGMRARRNVAFLCSTHCCVGY